MVNSNLKNLLELRKKVGKLERGSSRHASERIANLRGDIESRIKEALTSKIPAESEKLGWNDEISVSIMGDIAREIYSTEAEAAEAIGLIREGLRSAHILTNSELLSGYDPNSFQEKPGYKKLQETINLYLIYIDK